MGKKELSFRYEEAGKQHEYQKGLICALLCAFIWGVLPIYWKALSPINSILIIFYRIVFAFICSLIVALVLFGWKSVFAPLREKGVALTYFIAGFLISANWGIYIWAVNSGHIIETSIGYYIEPLAVCVFGIVLFHEKLDKYKAAALLFALAGVLFLLIYYGEIPLIALGLAVTFSTYAAIKKKLQINALLSMVYETMFMVPLVLPIIIYMEVTGKGALAVAAPHQLVLLLLCGIMTATPLMLFAQAAYRVDMITLGVTEYISPSLGLILGIFIYHEPFDKIELVTFALIWVGLIIFTLGGIKNSGRHSNEALSEAPDSEEGTEANG